MSCSPLLVGLYRSELRATNVIEPQDVGQAKSVTYRKGAATPARLLGTRIQENNTLLGTRYNSHNAA